MFDYKAHGVESAAVLETYAEQIAALDHDKPLSLIDLGRILREAEQEIDEAVVEAWAAACCHLTIEDCDRARLAEFALGPHYHRLQTMGASRDLLLRLLEGFDEDVDHGIDALETYGPIPASDLEILMGTTEPPGDLASCHPLLRFDRAALEELIALKTKNGVQIFFGKLARLDELGSRLEELGFAGSETAEIYRDLVSTAQEAIALFENLALLPHRRINDPDVLQASWPPVASAWSQLYEALRDLAFPVRLDKDKIANVRAVIQQLTPP
tara:strand:- start:6011 stop:6820 length:810 start_codon:yes stop_codon:yes gene_type:complete